MDVLVKRREYLNRTRHWRTECVIRYDRKRTKEVANSPVVW